MASFTFVQDYLRHRLTANNRHGIHSPFVYHLIDTVIYDYQPRQAYQEIAIDIKNQNGVVEKRLPLKVLKLIYRLAKHFNPAAIIEVGEGASASLYLQKAVPGAKIIAVNESELKEVSDSPVDMIFFNYDALTMQAFEQLFPTVRPDTVVIFTGVHNNAGTKQMWNKIKTHPRVTLTIDLFWISLVFFKSGRAQQEHFRIKY